jgi:hypothetical protein
MLDLPQSITLSVFATLYSDVLIQTRIDPGGRWFELPPFQTFSFVFCLFLKLHNGIRGKL